MHDLYQAIAGQLGPNRVSRATTERMIYARDLWPLHTLRLTRGILPPGPAMVVWPESEEEVIRVVRLAREYETPLTPYGGGSGVLGGAIADPNGVLLDLKRMARVRTIDHESGVCEVEPGLLGAHLEDRLNEVGLTLGHFPSSLMTASIGGYVVTRSAGQLSSRYGKIEDMLVSLRMVSGGGEVLDTYEESLRATGPDLNQVFLGSEGTLGIVTLARLKVHPAPASSRYHGLRFESLEKGLDAMRSIMQAGLRPSVMRLYDELDTYMALRSGHSSTPQPGQSATTPPAPKAGIIDRFRDPVRKGIQLALKRPGPIEALLERVLPAEFLLVLGFEGEPEEVDASMPAAIELGLARGGVDLGQEPGLRWLAKRYDVSFKMPQFFNLGAFVDTIEVASTWDRIPALHHSVRQAVGRHVLVMAHFSHAYPEGVSIYFSIGGSAAGGVAAEARYYRAWSAAMDVVMAQEGTVSHHHGVGKMKAPYVAKEQAGFLCMYPPLKRRLDPDGILNPGKLYARDPASEL